MSQLTVLDNSIRVITKRFPDRLSAAVGVWFAVGGRYENFEHKGVAHFMEHMAFKGSQNYSCHQIKQLIEGVGGNLNAFTSEEETCYYAKVPNKHFKQSFDILTDISVFPSLNKKDLEKERTVILEELKMYHDLPQYYVMELLEELIWPNHPLGTSLAGTHQTVSRLSDADIKHFHRHNYVPQNIVISVCGDIDHETIVNMVNKKLGKLKNVDPKEYLPAPKVQDKATARFFKKDTEQMHLALGYLAYETNHKDYYVMSTLSIILGGNMSSRLFNEVREDRGLAYSIGSSLKTLDDTGMFLVRAGVDNNKIVDAMALILKVLEKIAKEGVKDDELKRAKEYFMGQFQLGLEDNLDYMIWLGAGLISRDRTRTVQEVLDKIKAVTSSDIKRVARDILNPNRLNVSLIGPLDEAKEKKLRKLAGVA